MTGPLSAVPGGVLIATQALAHGNRPGDKLLAREWITWHETANPTPGANAQMHRDFVDSGGGAERVSFHFAVDDQEWVQILPLDEVAWHAGDGCDDPGDTGCFRSIAIETCVNADSDWSRTKQNLIGLTAMLIVTPERFAGGRGATFSTARIAPHARWMRKRCPRRILDEGSFDALVASVAGLVGGVIAVPGAAAPVAPVPAFSAIGRADLASWFGGRVPGYRYDDSATGTLSALWRDEGLRTGVWPALTAVETRPGGGRLFTFANGRRALLVAGIAPRWIRT
jgi:hypothetical protein